MTFDPRASVKAGISDQPLQVDSPDRRVRLPPPKTETPEAASDSSNPSSAQDDDAAQDGRPGPVAAEAVAELPVTVEMATGNLLAEQSTTAQPTTARPPATAQTVTPQTRSGEPAPKVFQPAADLPVSTRTATTRPRRSKPLIPDVVPPAPRKRKIPINLYLPGHVLTLMDTAAYGYNSPARSRGAVIMEAVRATYEDIVVDYKPARNPSQLTPPRPPRRVGVQDPRTVSPSFTEEEADALQEVAATTTLSVAAFVTEALSRYLDHTNAATTLDQAPSDSVARPAGPLPH